MRNIYWNCVGETLKQLLTQKQPLRNRSERSQSPDWADLGKSG
jgi:hypothetical protein